MICKLNIVAGFKDKRSYLKDTFFTRPFRVADVGQYKTDLDLYLMVMSSSPGLLDDDQYDFSINVESGGRLQLHSQAYQRLFNMQRGASQQLVINLEPGSTFSYVPHPMVPHRNAKFKNHTTVHLQEDCELLLSEIITCGRKHSGEIFQFTYLQNLVEIYHKKKLLLKDNVWLCPQQTPLDAIGQLEGYSHQGTLVYLLTRTEPASACIDGLYHLLENEKDIAFGISELEGNGFVLRMLGNGGEQLFNFFKQIQEKLWPAESNTSQQAPPLL